jgi:PAS domain S-box-containing protein
MFAKNDCGSGEPTFLAGKEEMAGEIRSYDWASSALGAPQTWPQALKTVFGIALSSSHPMCIFWGADPACFYNDAFWRLINTEKEHRALGKTADEALAELWPIIAPQVKQVLACGESIWNKDQIVQIRRDNRLEERHWSCSFSPIDDDGSGVVTGVLLICDDTTGDVIARKRLEHDRERQQDVLQHMPGFAAMLSGPNHKFEFVNEAYRKVVGERSFVGRTVREVFPELGDQEFFRLLDRVYLTGQPFVARKFALHLNRPGGERFIDFLYHPVIDADEYVSGIFIGGYDVTDQVKAEQRRDALLKLDDKMRDLEATNDLAHVAAELLAATLGASRAGYGVLDQSNKSITIEHAWSAPGLAEVRGIYHFSDFGAYIDELLIGKAVAIADVRLDPRTADHADSFDELGIAAHIDAPVLEDGKAVAQMFVHSSVPRVWTTEEIAFVQEFSKRARSAIARRIAEADLHESEARFQQLAGAVDQIFHIADPETRKLLYVSPAYERIWGCSPEPLYECSERLLDTVHPDDRNIVAEAQSRDHDILHAPIEYRIVRPDGEVRWISDRVFPVKPLGQGSSRLVGVAQDITELKAAVSTLAESQAMLSAIVDVAPVGIIIAEPNGRVVRDNAANRELWGVPPDTSDISDYGEWVGFWAETGERIHAEDWAMARALTHGETSRNVLIENKRFGSEERRLFLNNAAPVHNDEGKLIAGVVFEVDVTERIKAERRLRFLSEVDEALRTSPDAKMSMKEVATMLGTYLQASRCAYADVDRDNDSFVIHEDYTASEVESSAGNYSLDLFGERAAHDMRLGRVLSISNVGAELASGQGRETFQAIGIEAIVCCPLVRNGRLVAMMAVHQNTPRNWTSEEIDLIKTVVERCWTHVEKVGAEVRLKTLNETLEARVEARTAELIQAQDALRQAQKMEAMGQLTGGVAHDFNNLLTPIVGSLDLLQRKGVGNEREQRLISGAMQSAEKAKTLVQRLLAFARRQPLQPVAVNCGALIENMADLIASTLGPKIEVLVDTADDIPAALADPNQLEMAILNLSVNARDAMEEGGTLRISAAAAKVSEEHGGLAPGTYVRISVADTGIGMDEATLERAVEPFFSTKGIGKGTGLGLSMVHGLASQLRGALEVRSEPGLGTNVELWLPVASASPALKRNDDVIEKPTFREGTVLLVDDEDLVRASTAEMLLELGYEVIEASSGEEALKLIESGLDPDILVTDHLMPGLNGTELAQKLLSKNAALRTLIVSGYAESDGISPELPRLSKPFKSSELAASLAKR